VTLRRRLVLTMMVVVTAGLVAVDVVTFTSLRSFLVGRVDSQLSVATQQVARLVVRSEARGRPLDAAELDPHLSSTVYVEILDPSGDAIVVRPSGSGPGATPAPRLPRPLAPEPLSRLHDPGTSAVVYRPQATAVTVGSVRHTGPWWWPPDSTRFRPRCRRSRRSRWAWPSVSSRCCSS